MLFRSKYEVDFSIIEKEKESKKSEVDIKKSKLDTLITKDKEYKKNNIDILLQEYNSEKLYKDEYLSVSSRYEALTSDLKEIDAKYKEIFFKLKENRSENIGKINYNTSVVEKKINALINDLIQKKDDKIKEATGEFIGEKVLLEPIQESLEKDFVNINLEVARAEFFPFNKENISGYEENIKTYEKELSGLNTSIRSKGLDIIQIDRKSVV